MPTYEYACTACDHRFEAVQSFSDPNLTECPVCEGKVRKLFSSVGIVFRGSGFYRTDSRSGPGAAGGEDGKPDGKSDAKSKSGEKSAKGDKSGDSPAKSDAGSSGSSGSTETKPKGTPAAAF